MQFKGKNKTNKKKNTTSEASVGSKLMKDRIWCTS